MNTYRAMIIVLIDLDDARTEQSVPRNVTGIRKRPRALSHSGKSKAVHLKLLVWEWSTELDHAIVIAVQSQVSISFNT
jgi:hypothetical protein